MCHSFMWQKVFETSVLENTFLIRLIESIKKPRIKEIFKETQVIRKLLYVYK